MGTNSKDLFPFVFLTPSCTAARPGDSLPPQITQIAQIETNKIGGLAQKERYRQTEISPKKGSLSPNSAAKNMITQRTDLDYHDIPKTKNYEHIHFLYFTLLYIANTHHCILLIYNSVFL